MKAFLRWDLLLLLKCRDMEGDVFSAIREQLLPLDAEEHVQEGMREFIRTNQERVLILMDGLDEARESSVEHIEELFNRKLLPQCYLAATSRQEKGIDCRTAFDSLLEIKGFTKTKMEEYVKKYFGKNTAAAQSLLEKISENQRIEELTVNPLNTMLLCIMFEHNKGHLPSTQTELYEQLVQFITKRYCTNEGLEINVDTLMENLKEELEIPKNEDTLEKQFQKYFVVLGKLAFEGLKRDQLHFFDKDLSNCHKEVAKIGFLFKEESCNKLKQEYSYSFLHKTVQEFFAAYYFAGCTLSGDNSVFAGLDIQKERKQMWYVLLFVSGLLKEKASLFFDKLGKISTKVKGKNLWLLELLSENRFGETVALSILPYFTFPSAIKLSRRSQPRMFYGICYMLLMENRRNNDLNEDTTGNASLTSLSCRECSLVLEDKIVGKMIETNTTLTTLNLSSNKIGYKGAVSIGQGLEKNTTLTTLDLSNNRIGNEGAVSIGQGLEKNTTLTTLYLWSNKIGNEGAVSIGQGLGKNTTLTTLMLWYNKIGNEGAVSIGQGLGTTQLSPRCIYRVMRLGTKELFRSVRDWRRTQALTTLYLPRNKIGKEGAVSIGRGLEKNTTLTLLNLSKNEIGDEGAVSIGQGLEKNTTLTTLYLLSNKIGDEGAVSIGQGLEKNTTLTTLDLSRNEIGEEGAVSIGQGLEKNTTLTTLYLLSNKIGDEGAVSIGQGLEKNTTLTTLYLSRNKIGKEGAVSIGRGLEKNTTLTLLNLSKNEIGDEGAVSIGQGLEKNTTLTTLYLLSNKIGDEGAVSIGQGLEKNTTLTTLDLSRNEIGEEGAVSIGQGLEKNTTLTKLDLSSNKIGNEGAVSIGQGLEKNTTLTTLYLFTNNIERQNTHKIDELLKRNEALLGLQ